MDHASMRLAQSSAVALASAASLLAGVVAPASAESPALLSHRAVYELSLSKADGPKAPASARGMIVFDFDGSRCEGYTTTFRQMTEIQPQEGEARSSDMTSTAHEEADGRMLRFRISTRMGEASEQIQGEAERSPGGLSIALRQPQPEKIDLGVEPVFPTQQTIGILAAAKAGQTLYEVKLYDGSESGKKIYDTLTVIGKATREAKETAAQDQTLKDHPRWRIATSYFEEGKGDGAPAYVISYDLYENGVSRDLRLDYGDFTLTGEMTKFEARKPKECK